jgi:hypothetical protein
MIKRFSPMNENDQEVKKKVILHIGSPKVGSTALQVFLHKNRDNFRDQGFDYQFFEEKGQDWRISRGLTGGDVWNPIYPTKNGSLATNLLQTQMLKNVFEIASEQLKSCHTLFVSNEFLYFMARNQEFWKICEDFSNTSDVQISIVMYLRNPFDFLYSWYSESVKRRYTTTDFSEYLTNTNAIFNSVYNEIPRLLKNSTNFGIPISLFGPQDYQRDIPSHFINLFGVDTSRLLPPESANKSLSVLELEFFRGVHSVSKELGLIFCYEVTDSFLASLNPKKVSGQFKPRITRASSLIATQNLLEIKNNVAALHPTLAALSYEIPASFLLPPLDSDTEELLAQAFEIGVMCGRSFKGGYLANRLR